EHTVLLIGPDGIGHLAEGSAGSVWLVSAPRGPVTLAKREPLTAKDIRIVRIDTGGSIDLKTRAVSAPFEQTLDTIEHGAASRASFASQILFRNVVPDDES